MIYFLTTRKAQYTVCKYLATHGAELVGKITPVTYDEFFRWQGYPVGTYIFADIERLSPRVAQRAAQVRERLLALGTHRVLNDPLRTMKRYQLLRTLYERGLNTFNIYRVEELLRRGSALQRVRYPVFVRGENDHRGALTPLLHNERELLSALRRLRWRWNGWSPKVVTEFCNVADGRGVFRKYSAFRVGDRILARHIFFSDRWSVKAWKLLDPDLLAEERHYFDTNPHEAELREIFELACVEFGRIDYGVLEERIQVWEINSNPMLPVDYAGGGPAREPLHQDFRHIMRAAFEAIDHPPSGTSQAQAA